MANPSGTEGATLSETAALTYFNVCIAQFQCIEIERLDPAGVVSRVRFAARPGFAGRGDFLSPMMNHYLRN